MSENNFRFISDKQFRELVQKGESTESVGIHKGWPSQIKGIDEKARTIDFTISTESPDRMKDIIKVSGWALDHYKNNPVVLFGHDHGSPPIGRATKIVKRPKKKTLEATAEFASKEVSPFADMIFNLYKEGFMKATSVGFMPLKFEFSEDEERQMGIDFLEQDLLEFSAVSVPANPEALMGARSKGIDTQPLKEWAEKALDQYEEHEKSGLIIPRKTIEQLRAKADPKQKKQFENVDTERAKELAKQNLENLERQDEDQLIKSFEGMDIESPAEKEGWADFVQAFKEMKEKYSHGLIESTKDLKDLYVAGLELLEKDDMEAVINGVADQFGLEKDGMPEVEELANKDDTEVDDSYETPEEREADEDTPEIEEEVDKDLDDGDEVIEIDNEVVADEDKDLGEEAAEDSEELDTENKELADEVDEQPAELDEDTTYKVAETILENLELALDLIEAGDFDVLEDSRRGRRITNDIVELSVELAEMLDKSLVDSVSKEQEADDTEDTEEKFIEIEDEEEPEVEKDVDDDDEIEIDMDDEEFKALIQEEIRNITREEVEKVRKKVSGAPD